MAFKKKRFSTKVLVAIVLLIIVIPVVTATVVYTAIQSSSSQPTVVAGVNVGDTFTYNITAQSILFSSTAVTPDYLYEFNSTDYYQVTITGVSGSLVTFDTTWKFQNGTEITTPEYVDIATGNNSGDFWAIYPSNLKVNNFLSPKGYDKLIVNSTDTYTYTNSTRPRNWWSIENVFTDTTDPTGSTQQDNFISVYFDKQTGMLTQLTNIQQYNNPQYNVIITWKLTKSSVWDV